MLNFRNSNRYSINEIEWYETRWGPKSDEFISRHDKDGGWRRTGSKCYNLRIKRSSNWNMFHTFHNNTFLVKTCIKWLRESCRFNVNNKIACILFQRSNKFICNLWKSENIFLFSSSFVSVTVHSIFMIYLSRLQKFYVQLID